MTKFTIVTVLALTVWGSYGLRAQALQDGIWTGELQPSNQDDAFAVSMEVTNGPDGLAIDFTGPGGSVLPLSDIDVTGDTLSFSMELIPGVIACMLHAQDGGSYAGECTAPDVASVRLSMIPPED